MMESELSRKVAGSIISTIIVPTLCISFCLVFDLSKNILSPILAFRVKGDHSYYGELTYLDAPVTIE